jgi:hypothetical protein
MYSNPFGDKKNSFTYMQNVYYSNTKTIVNDVEVNKSNSLGADLEWNRWFKGGFGAGLELNFNSSGQHPGNNDQLNRYWAISPSISYGTKLGSDKLYTYFRAGATFGNDKDIYKTPTSTNTDKANLSGFDGTVAFPWRVFPNTFLTPKLVARNLTYKYDDGKERTNSFGLVINPEVYLRCDEMRCDCHHGYSYSKKAYDQGSVLIDYTSGISALFGNSKFTYNGPPSITYENTFSNIFLNGGGSLYVIDGVAIGTRINIGSMVQKSKDTDNKYTWSTFGLEPNVTANLPVNNGWRNLFVQGRYTLESNKYKTVSGTFNNTDNFRDRGFTVGFGYNSFIEEHTAMTIYLGYRSITTRDKSNGDESTNRGLYIDAGTRISF